MIDIETRVSETYLYIKQHEITGLKYFGKTTRNPYTYNGSGKHWLRHIKKHGIEHVKTLSVFGPYTDKEYLVKQALAMSDWFNIVEYSEWANLKPENGLDGGTPGTNISEEHKAKMSAANKGNKYMLGKTHSDETRAKMSAAKQNMSDETKQKIGAASKGRTHSDETRAKMSAAHTGKIVSSETRAKMSAVNKGKILSDEARAKIGAFWKGRTFSDETRAKLSAAKKGKIINCPHCNKSGGLSQMKRWHFDNCKEYKHE